ncbi:MAG: NUDIX hydrolase [Chloroflexota bacterium]
MEPLSEFLSSLNLIHAESADWGEIQLQITYYRSDRLPPSNLVSSVRGLVLWEDKILVVEEAKDQFHVLPGGRCEGNESFEETARREILEETGWLVNDLNLFGFAHLRHTTPKPNNYPYPYPDFIWLIYTANATEHQPNRMFSPKQLADEFVIGAKFVEIAQAANFLSERDQSLIDALRTML